MPMLTIRANFLPARRELGLQKPCTAQEQRKKKNKKQKEKSAFGGQRGGVWSSPALQSNHEGIGRTSFRKHKQIFKLNLQISTRTLSSKLWKDQKLRSIILFQFGLVTFNLHVLKIQTVC